MVANVYGMEPVNVTEQIENVPYKDAKTGQDTYHGAPAVKDPADAANKKDPAECNWDNQTIGEYLACQLGFNSTSTATMVVIGALVLIGIVALKK